MPTIIETETPAPQTETVTPVSQAPGRVSAILHSELAQSAGRVVLYSFPALLFIRAFYLADPDIWWHLRTGEWILQHHTVPTTDPFSSYGVGKPWVAYSWLFETAITLLYRAFGLVAIVIYEVAVRVALPVAMFHLIRGLFPSFWRAAALTAVGLLAITTVIGPRSGMLTILFLILELDILLFACRTGCRSVLWLLPPMFTLWANWHIQFVYGLFVLGVFVCEPLLNALMRYTPQRTNSIPSGMAWLTLLASAFATLLNPYGVKIYSTVFGLIAESRVYDQIAELMAMTFRQPQHFVVLFLALGAALTIGRRRNAQPRWLILLIASSLLAFRSVREIWFLAIVSVCVIADSWDLPGKNARTVAPLRSRLLVGAWVLALVLASGRHYGLSSDALEIQVAGNFPEAAARFIEQHDLDGPLFNDLSWGGFLIWRLPQLPVALDGRTNVYGEDRILQFSDVWKGKPGWDADPDLARANLVITPRDAAIASLLRFDPRFLVAYEDAQAVVFARQR